MTVALTCETCKIGEMRIGRGEHEYREEGLRNVWLVDWPMYVCVRCGSKMAIFHQSTLDLLTRQIAKQLVRRRGRLDGGCIRFLRSEMGLRTTELAEILAVDRVSVSRWENNKIDIDPYADFRLRMEAIDKLLGKHERRPAKEHVAVIFQYSYDRSVSACDHPLRVQASALTAEESETESAPVLTA